VKDHIYSNVAELDACEKKMKKKSYSRGPEKTNNQPNYRVPRDCQQRHKSTVETRYPEKTMGDGQ
jgi:hypothetical protein